MRLGLDWGRWLDPRLRADGAFSGLPVLVAGASGFLGGACAEALASLGARVTMLSRAPNSLPARLGVREIRGDISDPRVLRAAVEGQAIVLDMVGTVPAVESNQDPERSLREECGPHLRLFLECARAGPGPLVVFPSSRLVYGRPVGLPVGEEHPTQPRSMYAVHKLAVEGYLRVLTATRGLRHVILRISNPFGPFRREGSRGHGILSQFIRMAWEGSRLVIYGDGTQLRDYIFVADAVSAILLAAISEGCCDDTFNLGGQEPIPMVDAAERIATLAGGPGVDRAPWPRDALSVETGDYVSDVRKLKRRLGGLPHTPFDDGVRATLACYG